MPERTPPPNTGTTGTKLTFRHALSQLAVVCRAENSDVALADVQRTWGKIIRIELLATARTATYAYATQQVSFSTETLIRTMPGPDCATPLSSGGVDIRDKGFEEPVAAGMYAPFGESLTLKVYTQNVPDGVEIPVSLTGQRGPGNRHLVTLSFFAQMKIEPSATLVDWKPVTDSGSAGIS